jgi:protein required for attachment to host cells
MTAWILVADSVRARIFSAESPTGGLNEITSLAHPEGRLHEQDLTTDRSGRAFESRGHRRSGMSQQISAKEQENIRFAQRVAEHLESNRKQGKYQRLVLVAAPEFLGQLSARLSEATSGVIVLRLDKNLAHLNAQEIRAHLPDRMWSSLPA